MIDFIIMFDADHRETPQVEAGLQQRPGVSQLPAQTWTFPWGTVTAQNGRFSSYAPLALNGSLYFCVGRPRVMGWCHEQDGPHAFSRHIKQLFEAADPHEPYRQLTGMYVLVHCHPQGVSFITDRMGVYPVYHATPKHGRRVVLGTFTELVADLAGRKQDYDVASIGEVLMRGAITFPHTTRHGMTECSPGSRHDYHVTADGQVTSRSVTLWEPGEPSSWPSLHESQQQLLAALQFAGQDITRGSRAVAVTLSGGVDSRTVICSVPDELRAVAVTYADHENRETRVAAQVAATLGVPHHLAMRSADFYVDLAVREPALLGIERGYVHAHGFAAYDCPPDVGYDLLLGGHLSDTLLKGCYAYHSPMRRALRHPIREYRRRRENMPFYRSRLEYPAVRGILHKSVADAIDDRIDRRLESLAVIRPETAGEWFDFYPLSRRGTISYTQADARLFPGDQLFLHSRLIDSAAHASVKFKVSRQLTDPIFNRVAAKVVNVVDANTGLRTDAARSAKLAVKLRQKLKSKLGKTRFHLEVPWYTEGSWVAYERLQQASGEWAKLRHACLKSVGLLGPMFNGDPRNFVNQYHSEYGANFNYTLIKVLISLRQLI